MFTGIIKAVGHIAAREPRGGDLRLLVDAGGLPLDDVALGDSIAISGVCLTVTDIDNTVFAADVSTETLRLTTLGELQVGARVNLEKALRLSDRLGGHLVSGHVDGIGRVTARTDEARSQRWVFEAPAALMRYIATKGSICIDGVSLTVNDVGDSCFGVNLIPHTVEHTAFADRAIGDPVNIEIDMVARYVERLNHVG